MPLTGEQRDAVVSELKRIGASLNLSDDQKQKLQAFMTEASEKVQEYRQQNPNATQQDLIKKVIDNRAALRQRLVNFLHVRTTHKVGLGSGKCQGISGAKTSRLDCLYAVSFQTRPIFYRRVFLCAVELADSGSSVTANHDSASAKQSVLRCQSPRDNDVTNANPGIPTLQV